MEERWPGARMGGMVLVIDVGSAMPAEVFGAEVDRYIKGSRETYEQMPGYDQ